MNIVKFLRTPILKGICEQLLSRRSEGVEEGNIRQDGQINIRKKKFEKSTK